jgi:hypothetical protein
MVKIFTNAEGDTTTDSGGFWSGTNFNNIFNALMTGAGTYLQTDTTNRQTALEREKLALQARILELQQAGQSAADAAAAAAAEAAARAGNNAPPEEKGTPKWVMPVAIIGGIALFGGIAYFAFRNK